MFYAEIGIFSLDMDIIVGSIENTIRRTCVIIKFYFFKYFSKIKVPLNCQYYVPKLYPFIMDIYNLGYS